MDRGGSGAVAAVGVAATLVMLARRSPPLQCRRQPSSLPTPLTTLQGREQGPSFSPDGNSVAFAWNGEDESELGHLRQAPWDLDLRCASRRIPHPTSAPRGHATAARSRSLAIVGNGRPSSSCRLLGGQTGRSSSASRRCCAAPSSVCPGRPTVERSSLFRLWRRGAPFVLTAVEDLNR